MSEVKDTENFPQPHFSIHPDSAGFPPGPDPACAESEDGDSRGGIPDEEPDTEDSGSEENLEKEETPPPPPPLQTTTALLAKQEALGPVSDTDEGSSRSFPWAPQSVDGNDAGTEEEQAAFMTELDGFFRGRGMEFKPPKFYGEGLNCLKLWRAVIRLGGYDTVTSCKLWRQVGESFNPPRTCTTVSWSFRCFYEKALLDYERHKVRCGELHVHVSSPIESMGAENQGGRSQALGPVRVRRDAAARAMQGWHSQGLLGNGYVGESLIKGKSPIYMPKHGVLKRKNPSSIEYAVNATCVIGVNPQMDAVVADIGPSADWVKINVRRTNDCFEIYALVPGLLREEVRVQSDPAGRLVISGEPAHPDNPWGVTPFKKIVSLPLRIDPHQTTAVVTLHGQLFVRAPFEQCVL